MKFNRKEAKVLAIVLAVWGVILISCGSVMNSKVKPIIHTTYSVKVKQKKIAEAQAKTNEIKLKDITIEINNPLSVDIKDYLEKSENIDDTILKSLKLDTSLVNVNQAGTYQYTITYKKKKYLGTIVVKEKELPNVNFTLKTISLKTGEALSSDPKYFINENIPEEVYNNLTLNISGVDTTKQGDYTYYITYKGVNHQGKVEVRDPQPTVITPKDQTCPPEATKTEDNKCICPEGKTYNGINNTCIKQPGT